MLHSVHDQLYLVSCVVMSALVFYDVPWHRIHIQRVIEHMNSCTGCFPYITGRIPPSVTWSEVSDSLGRWLERKETAPEASPEGVLSRVGAAWGREAPSKRANGQGRNAQGNGRCRDPWGSGLRLRVRDDPALGVGAAPQWPLPRPPTCLAKGGSR